MKKHTAIFFIVTVLVLIVLVVIFLPSTPISPPISVPSDSTAQNAVAVLGTQTKLTDCQIASSLPDSDCTPGAVFPNVTKEQICTSGYAKSVRSVSESTKNKVFAEYNITSHTTGEYEVDHLISLELGGSNDISNLWPEAASPTPGFHEKDKVENYLHQEVCSGTISLAQAQYDISHNWLQVYQEINSN